MLVLNALRHILPQECNEDKHVSDVRVAARRRNDWTGKNAEGYDLRSKRRGVGNSAQIRAQTVQSLQPLRRRRRETQWNYRNAAAAAQRRLLAGTHIFRLRRISFPQYSRSKQCDANFNFTVLDCAPVTIGDDVFFGPNVCIATAVHPLIAVERNMYETEHGMLTDREYAKPIVIQSGCWIASNVVVCGGVTIGQGSVIGAGSVVTRDIPEGVFAAGNPCRVIRKITEQDSVYLKKELWSK